MDGESPKKQVSDLLSWRRDWGRPPRIILYGEWLSRGVGGIVIGVVGILCCYAALGAPPHEFRSFWSEWFFRISVGLLGLGIVVVAYHAYLRQVWRTQLYFTSFDMNAKVQAEFDDAWDSEGRLTEQQSSGAGENPPIGSPQFQTAVMSCRLALEQSYSVEPLTEDELAQPQKALSKMAASPLAHPVVHVAFRVTDGRRRATVCVVGYGGYVLSSSGDVVKGSVTQVVLFQVGPNLGRFWIRPETLTDKLSELFFPSEIDPPVAPEFSNRFYFWAEHPGKIDRLVPSRFYDAISSLPDLIVVGSESHLMAARELYLSPTAAKQLVEFAFRAIALFSK